VNLSADYNALLSVIKRAGKNAMENEKPVDVCFGKVLSTEPLQIMVDQKLMLGKAQLVLTKNVVDHDVDVTVAWSSDSATCDVSHSHGITGRKKLTVHKGLKVNELVVLLRAHGGQKYIILDRVG